MGSRRGDWAGLLDLAVWYDGMKVGHVLVEEDFAVLFARKCHLLEARDAGLVRLWALQEAAVATDRVAHAVLSCAVEFWRMLITRDLSQIRCRPASTDPSGKTLLPAPRSLLSASGADCQ
jgi:hypothetical protein